MDSKQIVETMRLKLPVKYNGITYQRSQSTSFGNLAVKAAALIAPAIMIGAALSPKAAAEPAPPEARIDPPVVYAEPSAPARDYIYLADVPLDRNLQYWAQFCGEEYDVDFALILGMMEIESQFDTGADSGWAYGVMQIGYINHEWLQADGIDPMTDHGNIQAGVYMIGNLLGRYGDTHKALMAYNCGEYGAAELWAEGITETEYSRSVLAAAEKWEKEIAPTAGTGQGNQERKAR